MKLLRVSRRLEIVLLLVLALGVGASLGGRSTNSSLVPLGVSVNSSAESTADYCVGLGPTPTVALYEVQFINTSSHRLHVNVDEIAATGAPHSLSLTLPARTTYELPVSSLVAVRAVVSGAGVLAQMQGRSASGSLVVSAPCATGPRSEWAAAGLSTVVGTSNQLELFNPTGTPSVVNVAVWTAGGLLSPQSFQGIVIGPKSLQLVDLGSEIVNTSDVGVRVSAQSGVFVATDVESSVAGTSWITGDATPLQHALWSNVALERATPTVIDVANPSMSQSARVNIIVTGSSPDAAHLSVEVPPNSLVSYTLSPNTAVTPVTQAEVAFRSNVPVISGLVHIHNSFRSVVAPTPSALHLVLSTTLSGTLAVTNMTSRAAVVTVTSMSGSQRVVKLRGSASYQLTSAGKVVLVTSTEPVAVVRVDDRVVGAIPAG